MFKIPHHFKMRGGKLVLFNHEIITVNEAKLEATEAALLIVENHNANFVQQPLTLSEHELDSGINLEEEEHIIIHCERNTIYYPIGLNYLST
jgi:hypothetical protein